MLAGLPVISELALLQCLAMCLFLPGLLEPEGHWPGVSGKHVQNDNPDM